MSRFEPTERDRREWAVLSLIFAFALGVLGGLIVYGERVFGAAW